jgi:hypothetical protein
MVTKLKITFEAKRKQWSSRAKVTMANVITKEKGQTRANNSYSRTKECRKP